MFKKLLLIVTFFCLIIPIQTFSATDLINDTIHDRVIVTEEIIDISSLINQVDTSILEYYLEGLLSFGIRMTGTDSSRESAEWIKEEFENMGLYTYIDEWKYPRYKDSNVVAVHNGTDTNSDAVIVMVAHYDTTENGPGAVDDGTGVAKTPRQTTADYQKKRTGIDPEISGGCYRRKLADITGLGNRPFTHAETGRNTIKPDERDAGC